MKDPTNPQEYEGLLRPEPFPPRKSRPVFVLGSVRSGTSAVMHALASGAGLPGCREGHVTVLLQRIIDIVEETVGNYGADTDEYLIGRVDANGLCTTVTNYISAVMANEYPEGLWVDKSPDDFSRAPAIRSAPRMSEIFPEARFVYCLRRGIENVLSRAKKFPQNPFWYHCRSWAETVRAWFEVKDQLGDKGLQISQRELALEPERVATEIASFIGLDDAQLKGMVNFLTGVRVEQTRPATEHHVLGLDETDWDDALKEIFVRECGEAMELAGFTLEGEMVRPSEGVPLFYAGRIANAAQLENVAPAQYVNKGIGVFALGPGLPMAPARVTYTDILLDGCTRFTTEMYVSGSKPAPVRFGLEVLDGEGVAVMSASAEVQPRSGQIPWEVVSDRPLKGSYGVRVSTELSGGGNARDVEAVWVHPRFC